MKKILALVLALCMIFALAACGQSAAPAATEAPAADAATEAPAADAATEAPAAGGEYTLGMGVSLNMDSSKSGNAQVDATVAAVVLDAEGKIVSCRIDCAQSKMDISEGTVDTAAEFKTKMELGDDYGMVAYGNAIAEWDAQAQAFANYTVGKTADEIAGIETKVNEEGYNVAVDETLYASCSISIEDFIGAVVKACSDEKGQTFKASGVGTIAGSYVLDGKFQRGCKARITRDGEQIFDGPLASLKRFKDDVKEVAAGYECGLVFEKFNDLQEDDQIEAYMMVEVPR